MKIKVLDTNSFWLISHHIHKTSIVFFIVIPNKFIFYFYVLSLNNN